MRGRFHHLTGERGREKTFNEGTFAQGGVVGPGEKILRSKSSPLLRAKGHLKKWKGEGSGGFHFVACTLKGTGKGEKNGSQTLGSQLGKFVGALPRKNGGRKTDPCLPAKSGTSGVTGSSRYWACENVQKEGKVRGNACQENHRKSTATRKKKRQQQRKGVLAPRRVRHTG